MERIDIFVSLTDPIPSLRYDIELLPVTSDGNNFVALHDPEGYAENMLMFKPEMLELLKLFDGERSIRQLQYDILKANGEMIISNKLLSIVQTLDRNLYLDSEFFHQTRDDRDNAFRITPIRAAVHKGQSYPEKPEELAQFIGQLEKKSNIEVPDESPIGVIVPHIDLRVAGEVYIPAYRALQHSNADTFIIIGTSHYSDEDLFIPTEKDFETPFGIMHTDKEFVQSLRSTCKLPLTQNDIAHRPEHSIEFQVLFLQYFFGNDSKKIVPILCSSFHEILESGCHPDTSDKFSDFVSALQKTIFEQQKKVAYIISVDWSHVGLKFGDQEPASQLLPKVHVSDINQLDAVTNLDYTQFFDLLSRSNNSTHIDAFSCFSTFYFAAKPTRGVLLEYKQWHEIERESGVTFASVAFY